MGKKVVSKNQSGGITAGEINVGKADKKPTPNRDIPVWLKATAAIAGIAAAAFAIISYFG